MLQKQTSKRSKRRRFWLRGTSIYPLGKEVYHCFNTQPSHDFRAETASNFSAALTSPFGLPQAESVLSTPFVSLHFSWRGGGRASVFLEPICSGLAGGIASRNQLLFASKSLWPGKGYLFATLLMMMVPLSRSLILVLVKGSAFVSFWESTR